MMRLHAQNGQTIPVGEPRMAVNSKRGSQPLSTPASSWQSSTGKNLENTIASVAVERTRAGEALQILTGKLLEAQEEERRRIARELHDGLNQELAMLAVELGLVVRQVPQEATVLTESLLKLRQRAEGLSNDLRQITHQLHPAVLEHLGLISALRSHCAEFSQHEGIRTWFVAEQELGTIPPDVAICLYRITQEALRNVAKHSRAQEAWVKITKSDQNVQLSIIDRGMGFRPKGFCGKPGLGLVSMQERVRIVKGQLSVRSAPGEGTQIEIRLPIRWKEHRSEHDWKHQKSRTSIG